MTNQLGGWSVSWQGVFGAGHVCCMGPAEPDPAGHHGAEGHPGGGPERRLRAGPGRRAGAGRHARARTSSRWARRPTPRGWVTTRRRAAGRPAGAGQRAGGDRQAGDRRRDRRPSGRARAGRERRRRADGLPGQHRGRPGGRRRASSARSTRAASCRSAGRRTRRRSAATSTATAPSPLGDQPKFFDQLPGTGSGPGHAYNPLYPFGFGLSYTTFQRSDLSVTPTVSRHGSATARFTVTNTGTEDGTDIVPLYVSQPVSGVVTPPQRLVGFTRVTLEGRCSRRSCRSRSRSPRSAETQGDINASGPPTVEPGAYVAQLDKNTTTPYDVEVSAPFTVS